MLQSIQEKTIPPPKTGRHMWMAQVKTYLISPFKMLQKQVNMGGGGVHFEMNIVDDVTGVGVIKIMMVDDMGEGGVENDQKSDDVICGRPLLCFHFFL
jgi:hypothetical protein